MPKRFTDSEKWKDPWFRKLSLTSKLLFLYLCDQCDNAGFWEIDLERAAFDIGCTAKSLVTAMEPLHNRYETNGIHLWIRKFIQFQGNYPFNPNVAAHKGIMKLLRSREEFSEDITRLLEGKGLKNSYGRVKEGLFNPPSQGQGKGKGKGKGKALSPDFEKDGYSKDFEEFWEIFRGLHRAESKPETYQKWNATLAGRNGATGHPPVPASAIIIAACNYRDYCVELGTERQYIMQSGSFVGPKKRGWETYAEPIKTATDKQDERDERLMDWVREGGEDEPEK